MSKKTENVRESRSASQWSAAWKRLRRNKLAMVGMVIVGLVGETGAGKTTSCVRMRPASTRISRWMI